MAKVIAVIGSTGSQGGGLCNAILSDPSGGFSCRAITRKTDGDKAKALAGRGAQVVNADLDDVESLKKAFAGADGVYGVTNLWRDFSGEVDKVQAKNVAGAPEPARVTHIMWFTLNDTGEHMTPDDERMPVLQEQS